MKKTTSKNLSKKLAQYGALTVAIAGVADANGQITYTDENPDFPGVIGSEYFLDLNNDGTDDFRIFHNGSSNLYISPLTSNNDVLGSGGATFAYPFALSNGATISSGAGAFFNNGYAGGFQSLNYGSCSFGNWCSVTDRYIGMRFDAGGGAIHYGWARLDVDQDGSVWTVKDYAFNTTAGASILAGQQTLSINDAAINNIRVVALNKSIGMYNLPAQTNYRLYDITGKQVLNGSSNQNIHTIEAASIANGIFILEIEDVNTKAVLRKKLVL